MALYVTVENFDETKLSVGDIYAATKPVAYQKVPIKYTYESGDGPLIVRTPNLFSFGVCENRDPATDDLTGYSMPFVCFDERDGTSEKELKKREKEEQFIRMMEKITEFVRKKVDELAPKLKKGGRRKPINTDGLNILRYKLDKPDGAPVIYAKMFTKQDKTDKNKMEITTEVFRKKTEVDIKKNVKSCKENKSLVKTSGHKYLKQRCRVIGGLKIESVFVGASIESIQIKLQQLVVVKKVTANINVMEADLDLGSDSEQEEDEDSEEEEEVVVKPKEEVVVKRPTKKQPKYIDPEDEEEDEEDEDEDEDESALQTIKRR